MPHDGNCRANVATIFEMSGFPSNFKVFNREKGDGDSGFIALLFIFLTNIEIQKTPRMVSYSWSLLVMNILMKMVCFLPMFLFPDRFLLF